MPTHADAGRENVVCWAKRKPRQWCNFATKTRSYGLPGKEKRECRQWNLLESIVVPAFGCRNNCRYYNTSGGAGGEFVVGVVRCQHRGRRRMCHVRRQSVILRRRSSGVCRCSDAGADNKMSYSALYESVFFVCCHFGAISRQGKGGYCACLFTPAA